MAQRITETEALRQLERRRPGGYLWVESEQAEGEYECYPIRDLLDELDYNGWLRDEQPSLEPEVIIEHDLVHECAILTHMTREGFRDDIWPTLGIVEWREENPFARMGGGQ